ncbi:hypothetical protein Tco_0553195, partial [Tanacetum coccineum]
MQRSTTTLQEPNETLYQSWERFKELLMKCPQHYLTEMQEVILFYNGLDVPTKTDARSRKYNLGRETKKVNEKVYAAQVGCEQRKGPYYTKDCPHSKKKVKPLKKLIILSLVHPSNKEGNIEQQLWDSTKEIMQILRIKNEDNQKIPEIGFCMFFLYFAQDLAGKEIDKVVIMEYLVKISKKARILEFKRRHLKKLTLTSYTPYPSRKIRPLGWHLEEIHVTWAQLEKKRTRPRLYTKSFEEIMHTERGDGVANKKKFIGERLKYSLSLHKFQVILAPKDEIQAKVGGGEVLLADTTSSGGKKETQAMVFHKMETEEIIDIFVAPCFVNGLEAYDGEINLGVEENMISNEFAVKLCLEHEVKRGNKVVKKELIVALKGEIYLVKFIINPKEDDVEPGVVFGRSFLRLTKAIADFGNETITIYPELDPFLVSSEEEENVSDDWDLLLDDLDFGDIPYIEGVNVPQFV